MRGGSTLPTSILRDKGSAESLPHLFRGADTLPVGFEGNAEGFIPSARVFESNGEGGLLCPHFRHDMGGQKPSPLVSRTTGRGYHPTCFRGQRGGYDLPHHFQHGMDYFC